MDPFTKTGSTWVNYKIIETLHASIYAACMPYIDIQTSPVWSFEPPPNAYPKHFSPCVGCLEMVPSFFQHVPQKNKNPCFVMEIQ